MFVWLVITPKLKIAFLDWWSQEEFRVGAKCHSPCRYCNKTDGPVWSMWETCFLHSEEDGREPNGAHRWCWHVHARLPPALYPWTSCWSCNNCFWNSYVSKWPDSWNSCFCLESFWLVLFHFRPSIRSPCLCSSVLFVYSFSIIICAMKSCRDERNISSVVDGILLAILTWKIVNKLKTNTSGRFCNFCLLIPRRPCLSVFWGGNGS